MGTVWMSSKPKFNKFLINNIAWWSCNYDVGHV